MSAATDLFDTRYGPQFAPECEPWAPPAPRHLRAVPAGGDEAAQPRLTGDAGAVHRMPAARVAVLHPPRPESAPLRLTRRGVVVLAFAVAALGAALVWIAALSSPSDAASGTQAGNGASTQSVVTVRAGDTLWTIAGRTAPTADPRAEVDRLRALNHLASVALVPGQQLRLR